MASDPPHLPPVHEAWLPREHLLHRPRHGGRQLTALVCALIFLATPTLLWVVGGRPSEIENHALAGFPSPSDGWGLFTDLPTWATDQLVFRPAAISAADAISRTFFGEPAPLDQGETPNSGPLPGSPPPDIRAHGPTAGPQESEAGYRRVVEGRDGWLYYGFDADAKCSPTRPLDETLARLAELRSAVESSGRKFVFVVAPDKSTMVPQHLPARYPGKECAEAAVGPTWQRLSAPGNALDLRPRLLAASRDVGHPVYVPNGTHWTDEGSIVLAGQLADAVRPGATRTWQSRPIGTYSSPADLPPLLGRRGETKTNTRYELRPDGRLNRAGETITDISRPVHRGGEPITGTVQDKTLIYGDSFTTASSRYLTAAFSDLTMLASNAGEQDLQAALGAFTDARVVVVQAVERGVSSGNLAFLDHKFIEAVRARLAAHPIR